MRRADIGRRRSGRNVTPTIRLVCPVAAVALIDQAAEAQVESRSEWIRGKLAMAVADELKLEPEAMIALFDGVGLAKPPRRP